MLVACRDDRSVEVYAIGMEDGSLENTGRKLVLDKDRPSCLVIPD